MAVPRDAVHGRNFCRVIKWNRCRSFDGPIPGRRSAIRGSHWDCIAKMDFFHLTFPSVIWPVLINGINWLTPHHFDRGKYIRIEYGVRQRRTPFGFAQRSLNSNHFPLVLCCVSFPIVIGSWCGAHVEYARWRLSIAHGGTHQSWLAQLFPL